MFGRSRILNLARYAQMRQTGLHKSLRFYCTIGFREMSMRVFTTSVLSVPLFLFLAMPTNAADPKEAFTDISQVGPDFAFMGEFVGTLPAGSCYHYPVGLQVVALGDGKFQAAQYIGGLPGSGWTGQPSASLTGERRDGTVHLQGEPFEIRIHGDSATAHYAGGPPIGYFHRVHRVSPTMGAAPPPGAIVLFGGTDTGHLKNVRISPEGSMEVGTQTKDAYRDYTLHVEFRVPYMPKARGQSRGNSGVYLQSRYEVQILDSFGLSGEFNEAGALYRYRRPDVNMAFPPLTWQTYDIEFHAPRFDANGRKIANARLTVFHNGVPIHYNVEVERKTGGGAQEGPNPLPIKFQDHRDPVQFRNIWLVDHNRPSLLPYGCCRPVFQYCR